MFTFIRDALYYLWNGETKEEHDRREEERRRQQEEHDGVFTSQRQKMACSKMSNVIKGRSARNSESEVNSVAFSASPPNEMANLLD
jgi:hypothetical protein